MISDYLNYLRNEKGDVSVGTAILIVVLVIIAIALFGDGDI